MPEPFGEGWDWAKGGTRQHFYRKWKAICGSKSRPLAGGMRWTRGGGRGKCPECEKLAKAKESIE